MYGENRERTNMKKGRKTTEGETCRKKRKRKKRGGERTWKEKGGREIWDRDRKKVADEG